MQDSPNNIIANKWLPMLEDKSGRSLIRPNQEIALAHFRRMNDCYYKFLSQYSAPSNSIEL